MKNPVHIAVSGAAGQISYALIFRLIAGDLLGKEQPIILHLLELPQALGALDGVVMELHDCASPLLVDVQVSSEPRKAFESADLVFLLGATPRGSGMERRDLLTVNAGIFSAQGRALNEVAKRDVKVLVVGNPANSNALLARRNAPDLADRNFTAMTRLDHDRAVSMLARQCRHPVADVRRVIIWGNHSTTQYPDIGHALVGERSAVELVERGWYETVFIPSVQNRGAEVIRARGKSSAASAANAALTHMRDWIFGTAPGDWVSMGVMSDGHYGLQPGVVFSLPVEVVDGCYRVIDGLTIDAFGSARIELTQSELLAEREVVAHLL